MKIALAQYPIKWHSSVDSWKQSVKSWVQEAVLAGSKVLLFPEYGSMELVSLMDESIRSDLRAQVRAMTEFKSQFIELYQNLAMEFQVVIVAPSLPLDVAEFDKPVNRVFVFKADGSMDYQDKEHMTRFEDEQWGVGSGGPRLMTFDVDDVRFGINICFDVEFPFAAHELAKKGVHVLLAPSCTETMRGMNRVHVGARARAMENQYFVAVAQTVGEAPWSLAVDFNTGQAACFTTCDDGFPEDGVLVSGLLNQAQWVYAEIDIRLIEQVRNQGHVFNYKNMLQH